MSRANKYRLTEKCNPAQYFEMETENNEGIQLVEAINDGDLNRVRDLLRNGVDPSKRLTNTGLTALHIALLQRNEELAHVLISFGADTLRKTVLGGTPLHFLSGNSPKTISLITAITPNLDPLDLDMRTPLHVACYNGDEHLVSDLVAHGAKCNLKDNTGRTPPQLSRQLRTLSDELIEVIQKQSEKDGPDLPSTRTMPR